MHPLASVRLASLVTWFGRVLPVRLQSWAREVRQNERSHRIRSLADFTGTRMMKRDVHNHVQVSDGRLIYPNKKAADHAVAKFGVDGLKKISGAKIACYRDGDEIRTVG